MSNKLTQLPHQLSRFLHQKCQRLDTTIGNSIPAVPRYCMWSYSPTLMCIGTTWKKCFIELMCRKTINGHEDYIIEYLCVVGVGCSIQIPVIITPWYWIRYWWQTCIKYWCSSSTLNWRASIWYFDESSDEEVNKLTLHLHSCWISILEVD